MCARKSTRSNQLREQIAQRAARLMVEEGVRDFQAAKRKAADHLHVTEARQLPRNDEIEHAILEYQRLFRADRQPQRLDELRSEALTAMRFLARFDPCLVGPVLSGTADEHSEVSLHLFAETSEEVGLFLLECDIPYELGERRVRLDAERFEAYPSYRFCADSIPIELVVFPPHGRRQAPRSPVDGRPMQRAETAKVEALLSSPDANPLARS